MRYSPSEVRWAFQYYLGRPPESDGVINAIVNVKDIRSAVYLSKEGSKKKGGYYGSDEFCCWRLGLPKIVIISSCQAAALARVLAAMADVSVYACAIVKTQDPALASHLKEMIDDADFIIAAPLTEKWGDVIEVEVSTQALHLSQAFLWSTASRLYVLGRTEWSFPRGGLSFKDRSG